MIKHFWIVLVSALLFSCQTEEQDIPMPEDYEDTPALTKEESISISQFFTSDEAYKIKRFVERNGWPATQTPTGMYYYVYETNESGKLAQPGDEVEIKFKIRLLDADTTLCYASEANTTEKVLVEMENVESGIHEALTYLRSGEKAYVILPYYLAHGLAGDLNKVPPLSSLLYEIEVINVQ